MPEFLLLAASAFWIGLLTAISPCPLATNVAAVSFVSHRLDRKWTIFASGVLYTVGRSLTYLVISFLVVEALVNVPLLSDFLQRHINQVLGIVLILVGMVLLELISLPLPRFAPSEKTQSRLDRAGVLGSFLLGALFALAFCPVSAALFFGSLIPLAVKAESSIGPPLVYGLGTGLPVLAFTALVVAGSSLVERWYHGLARLGRFCKQATGVILIGIGIYYVLVHVFGVL